MKLEKALILRWDHLHIRGEYTVSKHWKINSLGSPPHTWRILITPDFNDGVFGITSTYVENTSIAKSPAILSEDHLHIRGEYG